MLSHNEIANQRIEQVETSHVKKLDLSDLYLDEIPNLSQLPWLEQLRLPLFRNLVNLDFLRELKPLKILNLNDSDKLTDFDVIGGLSNLEELVLNAGFCSDLSWLVRLNKLQKLSFHGYSFETLEPLSDVSLCFLSVRTPYHGEVPGQNQLARLEPLPSSLLALESLEISTANNLTNILPLAAFKRLKRLELACCKNITDVTVLCELTQLQSLYLGGCGNINSLAPVGSLKNLEELVCWGIKKAAKDESVLEIAKLPKLSKLWTDYFLDAPFSVLSDHTVASIEMGNCWPELKVWLQNTRRI